MLRQLLRNHVGMPLFLAAILLPAAAAGEGGGTISPERLSTLLKEGSGAWVVDVRPAAAFAARHIEGSMNIPLSLLSAKKLPPQKTIVLLDDSLGLRRGREAAKTLERRGNQRIYLLEGGISGWKYHGYPLSPPGDEQAIAQVTAAELAWAQENRLPVKIYDLRDEPERRQFPVAESVVPQGKSATERLKQVRKLLDDHQAQVLAPKLDAAPATILVLPLAADMSRETAATFFGFPGDVRYLDGGQAAWLSKPQAVTVVDPPRGYCAAGKTEGGGK